MSKKVLIISTSLRSNSNSYILSKSFAQGAENSGNNVELITLKDKKISFCTGCLSCQKTKTCIIKDDAVEIAQKMKNADVLVFATPIYYYEMSGQMKVMLDRANPLYSSDYSFTDVYMLSTAADNSKDTDIRALNGLEGWIACFSRARLAGKLFAGGVDSPGEIENSPVLKKAYEMGSKV